MPSAGAGLTWDLVRAQLRAMRDELRVGQAALIAEREREVLHLKAVVLQQVAEDRMEPMEIFQRDGSRAVQFRISVPWENVSFRTSDIIDGLREALGAELPEHSLTVAYSVNYGDTSGGDDYPDCTGVIRVTIRL